MIQDEDAAAAVVVFVSERVSCRGRGASCVTDSRK